MRTYNVTPVVLQGERCEVMGRRRRKLIWEPGRVIHIKAYLRNPDAVPWRDYPNEPIVAMTYEILLDRRTASSRPQAIFLSVTDESMIRPEGGA